MIDWQSIDFKGKSTGQVKVKCPSCIGNRSNKSDVSLSVNLDKGIGKCHYCEEVAIRDPKKKEQKEYKYPVQEWQNFTKLSDNMVKWFNSRRITQNTLIKAKITEETYYQPALKKEVNNVVFNYFEGKTLINKKYRSGDKTFTQSAGTKNIFYGINDIIDCKEIYIVEGEIDALSVFEAGFSNVISVPNGAGVSDKIHPEFISNSFGKLQDATKIIIAVDSDEKGLKLRESIAKIYGRDKCWFVDWPEGTKDANDVLVAHGHMALIECLNEAKPFPIRALQSASQYTKDVFDLYHHGKERGMSTGYTSVDEYYTVVPGELEVVTGIPSSGKTNWIDQICVNLSEQYGTKHAVCSFENPMAQHLSILAEKRAKKSFVGYNGARINEYELSDAIKWIDEHFVFIRFDDDTAPTVDAILEHARVAKIRYGITTLVVDPWNYIEQARKSSQSETEYTSEVLSKLRIFAQNYDVHVWLVAHPPKLQRDKDGQINAPTGYDISGSAHFYNKADVLTVVHRNATVAPQNVELIWRKVRFKMTGTPGQIMVRYNLATGCYEDNHG